VGENGSAVRAYMTECIA